MKLDEAMAVFGFEGTADQDQIKTRYHELAKEYHPDVNPIGTEMMQVINYAYETLSKYDGIVERRDNSYGDYGAELNTALRAIINLSGLEIEVCGSWIWVGGETRRHKDVLSDSGFYWASKKCLWYFRPPSKSSRSRGDYSMDDIRRTYGSDYIPPNESSRRRLPGSRTVAH